MSCSARLAATSAAARTAFEVIIVDDSDDATAARASGSEDAAVRSRVTVEIIRRELASARTDCRARSFAASPRPPDAGSSSWTATSSTRRRSSSICCAPHTTRGIPRGRVPLPDGRHQPVRVAVLAAPRCLALVRDGRSCAVPASPGEDHRSDEWLLPRRRASAWSSPDSGRRASRSSSRSSATHPQLTIAEVPFTFARLASRGAARLPIGRGSRTDASSRP